MIWYAAARRDPRDLIEFLFIFIDFSRRKIAFGLSKTFCFINFFCDKKMLFTHLCF